MPEDKKVSVSFELYDKLCVNATRLLSAIDSASRVESPHFKERAYRVEFSEKDRETIIKLNNMIVDQTFNIVDEAFES